ncbi:conjugal transfer protein TraR [Chimaeribacter californicus]|uniref:Conjugal transfer protein TraR n=1 Tax=Chimaeribacter californicus TaxID=2060067 RepID=A0A2N5E2W4_9GAMM|nr:TraR/DksA C4-type zinc finger protein [Chimaeribacter californicus]PLR35056.1 conjugal transfer protein TraR [Chimaeribacter californicus]
MKADWVDEAQEVTQLLAENQINRIRNSLCCAGVSLAECEMCGNDIPEARRCAVPGVRLCVGCQEVREFNVRCGTGRTI